ncbi:MAG: hybrid sensor histidine kinase/response regulator [Methylococcales bacterium]
MILTIDDEKVLRESFCAYLEDHGYDVIQAENGRIGLQIIEENKPDLVLVDLSMPVVDGIEVVHTVNQKYPEIPIIVVSGTGIVGEVVEAMRRGAWDYLTKPIFDLKMLLNAVQTALERARLIADNKEYQRSLEEQTSQLQREITERKAAEKQLIRSEKMAALGELVAGVAHEINTPVGIGITGISYLSDITIEFRKLFKNGDIKKSDLEKYLMESEEACQMTMANLNRAAELVASFKQVAVDQSNDEKRKFNLKKYVADILLSLQPKIKKTSHQISTNYSQDLELDSYPGAFSQIITNLVMNSLIHGFEEMENGQMMLSVESDDANVTICFTDNGKGLTKEQGEKIFDPFFTTKRGSGSTGLGMHLVYNLVTEKLQGEIECESEAGKGILVKMILPKKLV